MQKPGLTNHIVMWNFCGLITPFCELLHSVDYKQAYGQIYLVLYQYNL